VPSIIDVFHIVRVPDELGSGLLDDLLLLNHFVVICRDYGGVIRSHRELVSAGLLLALLGWNVIALIRQR
jgi:hypothetical protein